MELYARPEIGQRSFQGALGGDVPLIGSERLNETRVDVVVRGIPEETNSGVFKRPDVLVPGVRAKFFVV